MIDGCVRRRLLVIDIFIDQRRVVVLDSSSVVDIQWFVQYCFHEKQIEHLTASAFTERRSA